MRQLFYFSRIGRHIDVRWLIGDVKRTRQPLDLLRQRIDVLSELRCVVREHGRCRDDLIEPGSSTSLLQRRRSVPSPLLPVPSSPRSWSHPSVVPSAAEREHGPRSLQGWMRRVMRVKHGKRGKRRKRCVDTGRRVPTLSGEGGAPWHTR